MKKFVVEAESYDALRRGRFFILQEVNPDPVKNRVTCPKCYSQLIVNPKYKERGWCYCPDCGTIIYAVDLDNLLMEEHKRLYDEAGCGPKPEIEVSWDE